MANQWNAAIASQTVHFRGTSAVGVRAFANQIPHSRALVGTRYSLQVTGGVSGSFGAHVVAAVGGATVVVAGLTNISAAGNYVLTPVGFSASGAAINGTFGGLPAMDTYLRLDEIAPPLTVAFQSGVATAGISANCSVHMITQTLD